MAPESPLPRLICVLGPTASGKTELAVGLARNLGCELVSVDSTLVYRGLDIGSAKPEYPHHLVDICDPADAYSAARFAADARQAIEGIVQRGRTPLLVGGTMLYFRALMHGLAAMPAVDPSVRLAIEHEASRRGWPALHEELARVDPEAALRIHPNHSQRLCRALEVFRASGVPISEWQRKAPVDPPLSQRFDIVQFALSPTPRAVLHQRIALRFHAMMESGFLDEVRTLHARGDLHPALPALRAVGYRQLWQYLDGQCSLEQAVERGIAVTRQLAKRQLTWLRKWPDLAWIATDSEGRARAVAGGPVDDGAGIPDGTAGRPGESSLKVALRYLGGDPM